MTVYYNVFHCASTSSMSLDLKGLKNPKEMIDGIFHVVFDMRLCKECFRLTDDPSQCCQKCMSHKIRNEYALKARNIVIPPTECAICLDEVYYSRLTCGHYFHKTCFIKQNTSTWFYDDGSFIMKCPVCRTYISESDKISFFLA